MGQTWGFSRYIGGHGGGGVSNPPRKMEAWLIGCRDGDGRVCLVYRLLNPVTGALYLVGGGRGCVVVGLRTGVFGTQAPVRGALLSV